MKKIIIVLLVSGSVGSIVFFATKSSNGKSSMKDSTLIVKEAEVKEEVIDVPLKEIIEAFRRGNDDLFEANKKYVGKTLRITGRVSIIEENGDLYLQLRRADDVVICKGIKDEELLKSIKKEDLVQITGEFNREKAIFGNQSVLKNCKDLKKIK